MGRIVKDCDPCCNDWKSQVRELWNRYQEVVKKIRLNGSTRAPDGNGLVDLGSISPGAEIVDMTNYYTLQIFSGELVALNDQGTYWEISVI